MISLVFKIGQGYSRTDWDDILLESENIDSRMYTDEQLEQAISSALTSGNLTNYVKSIYPEYFEIPYVEIGWENDCTNKQYYEGVWNEDND